MHDAFCISTSSALPARVGTSQSFGIIAGTQNLEEYTILLVFWTSTLKISRFRRQTQILVQGLRLAAA